MSITMAKKHCWLFLVLAVGLTLAGCSQDEPSQKPAQAKPAPPKAAKAPAGPWVFGGLLLNGSPAPSLTPDLPLVLTCAIDNPLAKGNLVLPDLSGLKPVVRGGPAKEAVPLAWESPSLKNVNLEPKGSVVLHWLAKGPLKPGSYQIGLAGTDQLLDPAQTGVAGLRVESVMLTVVVGTADPGLKAYWQRRVLALKGNASGWLAEVESSLAKDPGNHGLLLERVDALAADRKPEQARQALSNLILETEKRLKQKDPQHPVHLPSWYYSYLRRLEEEAATGR